MLQIITSCVHFSSDHSREFNLIDKIQTPHLILKKQDRMARSHRRILITEEGMDDPWSELEETTGWEEDWTELETAMVTSPTWTARPTQYEG